MSLRNWLFGPDVERPKIPVVQQEAICMEDVAPAELPDHGIAAETKAVQNEFVHEIVRLGQRSAQLRAALARNALHGMSGS